MAKLLLTLLRPVVSKSLFRPLSREAGKLAIGATFALGSVGKDSPVGHIVTSLYDAALSTTMGFHVDYDKMIQQLYAENNPDKPMAIIYLANTHGLC